ncbi:DUF6710 family protein [Deinococcus sp. YIM 134068]|uniref:DUF6710 family protein n=1 Tax=Deinococcus lichenicola TaxID=3118910 RepID=UPI002F92AD6A
MVYPKGRPTEPTEEALAQQEAARTALKVVQFAREMLREGREASPEQRRMALQSMVKICVQQFQAERMAEVLVGRHADAQDSDPFKALFRSHSRLNPHVRALHDLIRDRRGEAVVRLADGLSITAPWHTDRLGRALLRYGMEWGRRNYQWRQQPDQSGTVYLPWGIYCVGKGNHSAASGMFWGDGELKTTQISDWTPLLEHVRLTKKGLVRTEDPERVVLASAAWPILALIGLGPLLIEQGGTYGARVHLED